MTVTDAISLSTAAGAIPGVGPKRAAALRRLGIRCVADLLLHLPTRYELDLGERTIESASEAVAPDHGSKASLSLSGEVMTCRLVRSRRPRFEATLFDGTGTVLLTWFNTPWLQKKIHPGMRIGATGQAKRHGDYIQLINPRWSEQKRDEPDEPDESIVRARPTPKQSADEERLRPIYPASEEISSRRIESILDACLEPALKALPDHLPSEYREARSLPTLAEAYRMIHRPRDEEEVKVARRRLALDELLLLQLAVMIKRRFRREHLAAHPLPSNPAIHRRILERFPFDLTPGQRRVIEDIGRDLAKPEPMNRLLQGDVGAGKTAVAVYAMLLAVAHGRQAALMAPTEILAEQHLASVRSLLEGARVRVELLTGSAPAAERERIREALGRGEIDVAIGTHALLTENVGFRDLAVAVVDEQHRFGVHQRAVLREKSEGPVPHTLVMTATPIPRTLSLTIFGDLDVSTIRGLPPGRMPIATRVVSWSQLGTVHDYVAGRIGRGEQAYFVVPSIDEADRGLASVTALREELANGPLKGRRVEVMHGRLGRTERDEIMGRFRDGDVDALVATTVIEVGVDVPNATMMIVYNAERFGLAQLHQLRGRVGRGSKRSLCVLVSDPTTDDARARLGAIADSADGFEIAEKDLEIRGPGDVFGTRQSGLAPFRVAELPRDVKLLELARRDAARWIEDNPGLEGERDALLRKRLLKAHGEFLGLGDVA